jgi:hypothetical protein
MALYADDPSFALRWPREIFASELRRQLDEAKRRGTDAEWAEGVAQLLRDAFSSPVPAEEFQNLAREPTSATWDGEEPF